VVDKRGESLGKGPFGFVQVGELVLLEVEDEVFAYQPLGIGQVVLFLFPAQLGHFISPLLQVLEAALFFQLLVWCKIGYGVDTTHATDELFQIPGLFFVGLAVFQCFQITASRHAAGVSDSLVIKVGPGAQSIGQGCLINAFDPDQLRTGTDGGQQSIAVFGDQQKNGVGGRFLEQLQQLVAARFVHFLR